MFQNLIPINSLRPVISMFVWKLVKFRRYFMGSEYCPRDFSKSAKNLYHVSLCLLWKGLTCIFSSLFSFYYFTLTCILREIVSIAGQFWLLFVQKCHYPAFLRCCVAPIPFWRYILVKIARSGYLSATKILTITGKSWANHIWLFLISSVLIISPGHFSRRAPTMISLSLWYVRGLGRVVYFRVASRLS